MVLTILFLILAILLLWMAKKEHGPDNGYAVGVCGVMFAIVFVCFLIAHIVCYYNFKTYISEYETTKAVVESYKGKDYGNMAVLTEKVIYINTKIANHKALSNSILLKGFYSKKVGELEPIVFNKIE